MTNDEVFSRIEEEFMLRNYSKRTMASYKRTAVEFLHFAGKSNFEELDQDDLRRYLVHLRSNNIVAPSTSNQYNAACKFLLKVILRKPVDEYNCPNAKIHRKIQPAMTRDQIRLLLSNFNDISSFTFFMLLYGTGLRFSEALDVKAEDIKPGDHGTHYIHVVHGKRDKERYVFLPDACYRALRRYWAFNKRGGDASDLVFPLKIHKTSAKYFLQKSFNDVRYGNTILEEFTPHSLRRSFATHLFQVDRGNIWTIKDSLGHANLGTTELYLGNVNTYQKFTETPADVCEDAYAAFLARNGWRR